MFLCVCWMYKKANVCKQEQKAWADRLAKVNSKRRTTHCSCAPGSVSGQWLTDLFTTCLIVWPLALAGICYDNVSMFPDFSNYFGDYNLIITDTNDVQNYKNKSQAEINQNFPLIVVAKKFSLWLWHSGVVARQPSFQCLNQPVGWRCEWEVFSFLSSTTSFALEQGREHCSVASSLLAAPRPETDWMWNRLLLLEKRKCSQFPPLDDCKLQYVYIHDFVRQSYIPVNLSVLLYCHKPNLGNVIHPNWQQGLGKYSPLLCIGL